MPHGAHACIRPYSWESLRSLPYPVVLPQSTHPGNLNPKSGLVFLWAKAFGTIWRNVQRAAAASEADDNVDADGDGVADVRQVSSEQLLRRKARLLLASVEPGEVATAAGVAWAGLLAVVTTVKARSAQTVALGSYLGTQAHGLVGAPLERTVKHALPEDQEKWARPLAKAVTGFVGVLVGWRLSSLIFAATASVRGANLALDGALALAGGLAPHMDASMRQLAVYVIAACGFYWQLSSGFGVPFLLQLPLLPLSMLDSAIVFLVAMV